MKPLVTTYKPYDWVAYKKVVPKKLIAEIWEHL